MAAATEHNHTWAMEILGTLRSSVLLHSKAVSFALAAIVMIVLALKPANALELISKDEAALPSGTVGVLALRGSPVRRPQITVVWPAPDAGLVRSPLELKLRFRAFGGSQINPETVIVTYVKHPAIDLTQRIKPFITADGVDIKDADVPPGLHRLWVEVRDKDGRLGTTEFSFQVAK